MNVQNAALKMRSFQSLAQSDEPFCECPVHFPGLIPARQLHRHFEQCVSYVFFRCPVYDRQCRGLIDLLQQLIQRRQRPVSVGKFLDTFLRAVALLLSQHFNYSFVFFGKRHFVYFYTTQLMTYWWRQPHMHVELFGTDTFRRFSSSFMIHNFMQKFAHFLKNCWLVLRIKFFKLPHPYNAI